MAMIYQASAGVANAKKLTISMWCRAHTTNAPSDAGDQFRLIEFGNPNGIYGGVSSYICLYNNGNGATFRNRIGVQFSGELNSVDGISCVSSNNPFGTAGETGTLYRPNVAEQSGYSDPYPAMVNFGSGGVMFTPSIFAETAELGSIVQQGAWFHVLIAVDTSYATSLDSPNHKLSIVVNGIMRDLFNGVDRPALPSGLAPSIMVVDPASSGVSDVFYSEGPFKWTAVVPDTRTDVTIGNIPDYAFDLNGFEIGIPSQRASPNKNTQLLDTADVQIWVGTYIDPTNATNFSKLVEVHNGSGSPVNPDIAADFFGLQTYLFKGQRDDFLVNNGAGGAFSYSGTITTSSGVSY